MTNERDDQNIILISTDAFLQQDWEDSVKNQKPRYKYFENFPLFYSIKSTKIMIRVAMITLSPDCSLFIIKSHLVEMNKD